MDYNTTSTTTTTTSTGNEKTLAVQIDDADGYHHHHTHPSSTTSSGRSKAGITPMALIVTRNVQKFFANKILQQESKSKSNDGGSGTEENTNAMDVCAVLHDVDEILDHRSIEDGRLLLRGMVADLLKEIDLLRYKYDTLHAQYMNVKEERDVVNHIYNDKIDTLTMTLQNAMRSINNGKSTAKTSDTDSLISAEWKQHMEDGNVVSADVATSLTIQTLMQKMEALHLTTLQQQDTIVQLHEQMEDLQCDNDAKTYKIMALEKQFTNINQKRTKVITKFGSTLSGTKNNGNNTNTSMILRPLRLNNIMDTTMTTATTPKAANKEVMVQGEEEVVFQEKEDYDSIYQDHKDNIIANIFIKNQPIVVAPTTNIEETATVIITDNDNHPIDPSTEKTTIDDTCDVVSEVDDEVSNIGVAKPTFIEVDESQGRVVAVKDEVVPSVGENKLTSSVVTTAIDIPDDEVEDDKENVAPTVVVQQRQSPFAAIFQSQPTHSKTTAFDDDDQQATTSTATNLPPVMVTPPPVATKHRTMSKKTTTILGDTIDRNMDQSSSSSNILKQSSMVGKTKQRHGPRAPRLVQLVEQV